MRLGKWPTPLVTVLFAGSFACAPPALQTPCNDDDECSAEERCVAGLCAPDEGEVEQPRSDAGEGARDAGFVPGDSGHPAADAGAGGLDAGREEDGGTVVDAGSSDAGPLVDAGADAGTPDDAGPDAGPRSDAGSDAGAPDCPPFLQAEPTLVTGCSGDATLKGCWSYDDAANDAISDGSGFDNHGTLVGDASLVAGLGGSALRLSGTGYVAVPKSNPSLVSPAPVSVETWAFVEALPATGRVVLLDNPDRYALIITAGGALRCSMAGSYVDVGVVPLDRWTHLACSYDGAIVKSYIDGALVGSKADTTVLQTTQLGAVHLGANYPSGEGFIGVLDETRVFDGVRGEASLCRVAASPPPPFVPAVPPCAPGLGEPALAHGCDSSLGDLRACFAFDNDGNGAALSLDGSGNENHGAVVGEATLEAGVVGLARTFDGATAVMVEEDTSLDFTEEITLETWLRLDAFPAVRAGIFDNPSQYGLFVLANKAVRCCTSSNGSCLESAPALSVGVWTHIACTYDRERRVIYVDGAHVAEDAVTNALATSGLKGLIVGANWETVAPNQHLAGALDDARVWSMKRSAGAICAAAAPP